MSCVIKKHYINPRKNNSKIFGNFCEDLEGYFYSQYFATVFNFLFQINQNRNDCCIIGMVYMRKRTGKPTERTTLDEKALDSHAKITR